MVGADDHFSLGAGDRPVGEGKQAIHVDRAELVDVLAAAQKAQDAAYGDSNDAEIDLLREALAEALGALGLNLPDGQPDDE